MTTTRRKNTRKRKRRGSLRLDRLAIVLTPFLLIIAAIIFFSLRSCRDDSPAEQPTAELPRAEMAQPASTQPAAAPQAASAAEVSLTTKPSITVAEAAARDAAAVEITPRGSMERQQALLDIHVRASRLRAAGFINAADEYLSIINSRLHEKGIL